jgi:Tfp pilus assembly protein PilE
MGQQQLLLIVIGVIIVGIAIVVGINLASTSAQSANRDAVIADLNNIGVFAQQYYRKPTTMGGGGNSFTGWTIPPNLTKTANGTYTATFGATVVTIVGTGNEVGNDGTNKVKATAVVTPTGITVTVDN